MGSRNITPKNVCGLRRLWVNFNARWTIQINKSNISGFELVVLSFRVNFAPFGVPSRMRKLQIGPSTVIKITETYGVIVEFLFSPLSDSLWYDPSPSLHSFLSFLTLSSCQPLIIMTIHARLEKLRAKRKHFSRPIQLKSACRRHSMQYLWKVFHIIVIRAWFELDWRSTKN